MTTPQGIYDPIIKLLDEKGIKHVAVIDDAYDEPVKGDFIFGELETFFTEIQDTDDAQEELEDLSSRTISNVRDIDNEIIQTLWRKQAELGVLKVLCNKLFRTILEKKTQLENFCEYISTDLGRRVHRLGSNDNIKKLMGNDDDKTVVKLIFIDYYLGPLTDLSSVNKSKEIAKKIYTTYPENEKPLIILMSSIKAVTENKDAFRDESGLLGGLFHFITKDDLANKEIIFLKLCSWAKSVQVGHQIQQFIEALENSIKKVETNFIKKIKTLSLEDYAYIQRLSLQEDGHPLGDYMLWLYSSYFGHLLFSENILRTQQNNIDKLTFEYLPPSQTTPSLLLAEIYKSALFDSNVGNVENHPRTCVNQETYEEELGHLHGHLFFPCYDSKQYLYEEQPYLHLGDLFIKDADSDVLMIINAPCDLAFAPGARRQFEHNLTIILIPGKLHPLNKILTNADKEKIKTELFEYNRQAFRIFWDTKKILSYKYGEIIPEMKKRGYKRVTRLRLPYALEVQHAFASDLTRVGMPVFPPIYQPVKVEVIYHSTPLKKYKVIENIDIGAAFIILTRNEGKCVFTVDFICKLKDELTLFIEELTHELENNQLPEFEQIKQGLISMRDNYEFWIGISTYPDSKNFGLALPPSGGGMAIQNSQKIFLYRNKKRKEILDSLPKKQYIIVNITDLDTEIFQSTS